MEHYVLCVWNGAFSEDDQILVTNYWDTLFPTSHQHQYTVEFACEVALLLNPVSKYIAVLNTIQEDVNVEWKDFDENFNVKDIISKEINTEADGFISKDFIEQLSTSIHALADQLPAFGTYKLDVLIGSNVLKDLSVSKEPSLSNAFFRLMTWHYAYFSIFIQSEFDRDRIDEWCEIINADIFHNNSKLELGAPLWRGGVQLQSSINNQEHTVYQGFELKFDLTENESKLFFHPVSENTVQKCSEHIVLSSKLQIVDEISFVSVPPYMITPVAFRLHIGKPNVLNEESSYFIDYLRSNKEVALIVRLEYAKINEKIKPERKYCSSKWQKAVASGCFRDPECFVSSFKNSITFAVTQSRESNHILAYPMRDTNNINADFCFRIFSYKAFSMSSHISEERAVDSKENILSRVPFIRSTEYHKIMEKYTKLSTNLHKSGFSESSIEDVSDSLSFWEDLRKSSVCSLSIKTKAIDLIFEEIDPSDWPERIQLLRKQMQNEVKRIPDNVLPGQGLKLPQQSFSVSNEDISQYFLPSGERKNSTSVEVLNPLNMDHFVTHDFDDVLHTNWPEIMNCIYHDMYYNSSCQTEDKESLGSQMVKLYIQHETASSCNKQQIIQSFSISVPEKHSSPYKEFRSPSCRQTNPVNQQRSKRDCVAFRENSMKDLLTKKVLFRSKTSHSQICDRKEQNTTSGKMSKNSHPIRSSPRKKTSISYSGPVRSSPRKKTSINYSGIVRSSPRKKTPINYSDLVRCSPRKKNTINNNAPVRCSPRKKNPANYNYPSGSRNKDKDGKNKKSQISDLLRKKIRSAVATALENNGINVNNQYYQPCGSRLFAICHTFLQDLPLKKGKTSEYLQKIADAHVKQVIEFFAN